MGDWHAPAPSWHAPATHTSPLPHIAPPVQAADAPQWSGSTWGSTQAPRQFTSPAAQDVAHVPAEQTCPLAHTTPFVQSLAPQ